MPATIIRAAVYNPLTQKAEQKTFAWGGRSKRTEAEARRLAEEWAEKRRKELAEMPKAPARADFRTRPDRHANHHASRRAGSHAP